MSRGFGRIEREIIEILDLVFGTTGPTGAGLAEWITGTADSPSVRRALKRLEAKGVVTPLPKRNGRSIAWVLTKTAKNEARRKRRRERDRARRQKRKYEANQENVESRLAQQRLQDRVRETTRLERLLGMLGSAHEGEVSNAARMIERERSRLGKTWKELLGREGFW